MLMSSPMADTGRGDVAMAGFSGKSESLAMTAPKSVFVRKPSRSAVTRRRSDIGLRRAHLSPAFKRATSDSRCIFDADLSIPLHERLMANRVKRLENCGDDDDEKTEIPPDSRRSVVVTDAVVDSVVACCLASNVLSPLSFMPVADEKFKEPTPDRCIGDCGPTPAQCIDDCGPTPVRCIDDCGPTPARYSADPVPDWQTCREEKANQGGVGETVPEGDAAATTLQADLADWDPEASVKSTRKRTVRRRRDTGNFLMIHMNMQTLDDELSTPEQTGSPSGIRFKARRSRRLRRKSMRLQMASPVVTEQAVENAVIGTEATTLFGLSGSPSGGTTCVAAEDRTVVSLSSPRQCEATPPDGAIVDIEHERSITIDEYHSPVEGLTVVVPLQAPQDPVCASSSERRPSRRCTQRTRVVEVDSPPKTPKKRGQRAKRGKKLPPVSLEDIYNNRLWRSQMPAMGKRWTTIAEEDDSFHRGPEHSTRAAVASSRTVDKPRSLELSDFYSKMRVAKRRQKARRQGWKPARKKLGEQTLMDELLESKLRALDNELLRVDH